jgi:hypothetical protein
MFRSLNSKPDTISPNFQDRDLNVVGKNYLLVLFTANNQHQLAPLQKLPTYSLRRNTACQKYSQFCYYRFDIRLFKFYKFSGTLVPLFT